MERIFVINDVEYVADNMYLAYLQALNMQGIKALGKCVKEKDGVAFMCHVCLDSYREMFPQFTDEDFLEYDILQTRIWCEYPHYKHTEHDGWEEYEVESVCKEGVDFLYANSRLARYMQETGFNW